MEKDKEIARLVRVLHRIAVADRFALLRDLPPDAAGFCIRQFNRILTRMSELEPEVTTLFAPLPENASLAVARMAAQDLAAYFNDAEPLPRGSREFKICGRRRTYVGAIHLGGRC